MSDLISREKFEEAEAQRAYEQGVKDTLDKYDETRRIASEIRMSMGCETAKECWELIRNGEIQRVKHGKWNHDYDDVLVSGTCSVCGWQSIIMETDVADMPYCPNCGAKMEMKSI